MSRKLSHVTTGGSSSDLPPYAELQARLEELEAYTHTVLQQYPRAKFKCMTKDYAAGHIGLDYVQPRVHSFLAYTKHCQAANTVAGVLSDLTLSRSSK